MNLSDLTPITIKAADYDKHEIYADSPEAILFTNSEGDGFGYLEVNNDGSYHVVAEASEITTASYEEAAQWLWDNWMQYSVY